MRPTTPSASPARRGLFDRYPQGTSPRHRGSVSTTDGYGKGRASRRRATEDPGRAFQQAAAVRLTGSSAAVSARPPVGRGSAAARAPASRGSVRTGRPGVRDDAGPAAGQLRVAGGRRGDPSHTVPHLLIRSAYYSRMCGSAVARPRAGGDRRQGRRGLRVRPARARCRRRHRAAVLDRVPDRRTAGQGHQSQARDHRRHRFRPRRVSTCLRANSPRLRTSCWV